MKKMMKRIVSVSTTLIMLCSFASVAFADDAIVDGEVIKLPKCAAGERVRVPIGDANYLDDGNGNLVPISELPSFANQAEADKYLQEVVTSLQAPAEAVNVSPRTTGDVIVATKGVGIYGGIKLHVTYTTSGDGNTGAITRHDAYTSFTGFTLGFGWDERSCYTTLSSSGRDVNAYAAGELVYYFYVEGFLEVGREAVNLSGTAYVVR